MSKLKPIGTAPPKTAANTDRVSRGVQQGNRSLESSSLQVLLKLLSSAKLGLEEELEGRIGCNSSRVHAGATVRKLTLLIAMWGASCSSVPDIRAKVAGESLPCFILVNDISASKGQNVGK